MVMTAVSEAVSVQAAMHDAVRVLCEAMGWAGGEYWETEASGFISRRTAWWSQGYHRAEISAPGDLTYGIGEGLPGLIDARPDQIRILDLTSAPDDFRRAEPALACGLNAVIGLPIHSGERIAVLLLFARQVPSPSKELTTGLEAICAHIGRFVERRRADEFRQLVESAPDAVVISDHQDRIVLVNARTEQLFGYRREELLGGTVDQLVPEAPNTSPPATSPEPIILSTPSGVDLQGLRRDGSRFPVEVSLRRIDRDGEQLTARSIRDLTARRQAEQLRFQLAAIVDSSQDAIIGSTLEGEITSWNRAAEEIFGYSESEAVGRPVAMLLPEEDEEQLLGRMLRGERIEHHDSVGQRQDGSAVPVSTSMSPIRDREGTLIGASKVIRDVTQRKLAEAALSEAKEAAEAANQALESFSYSVAHDLKSPLRSINGFSRILSDRYTEVLDEEGRRYLTMVANSALHMARLIDGLLELSRLGSRDLRPQTVDLSAVAATAAERLRQDSPDRQVEVQIQPGLTALGDATLLANVVDNLIGNAWKFTRDTPAARIEFGQTDDAFYLRDNGAGFDMAYADKLFGVFQRLHRQDEFEGTGIGLATVQRIITRHGGRIWAESVPGHGAVFRFTLGPARPPEQGRTGRRKAQRAAVPST
jgi:PAS domain S-box-containing protein